MSTLPQDPTFFNIGRGKTTPGISMQKFALIASTLLLLAPGLTAAEQTPTLEQIAKSGKIRIGYRQSEPPMSFRDNDGNPIGYSIDLCNRIVTAVKAKTGKQDLTIDYVPVNSQNRFSALVDNKIDILCGATTKTLSRSELVDFTQLTFVTGAGFMSLKGDPIDDISDLQGKKVAVVTDTTTQNALQAVLENSLTDTEVVVVDSATIGIDMLNEGKVAAYSSDQVVLIGLLFTADQPDRYIISGNLYSFEPFALAVRRNDADFRLVADRVLSRLYRTGQIVPIFKKWFSNFSDKVPSAIGAAYEINATPE